MTTISMSEKDRVAFSTAPEVNEQIRMRTDQSIEFYARHPELIPLRMRQLEEEWDIERVLEANASSLILGSVAFSILFSKKWLLFPMLVSGYLLNHAINGWCPPVPILRRLGVRTKQEIMREYLALRALQGDFDSLADARNKSLDEKLNAIEKLF